MLKIETIQTLGTVTAPVSRGAGLRGLSGGGCRGARRGPGDHQHHRQRLSRRPGQHPDGHERFFLLLLAPGTRHQRATPRTGTRRALESRPPRGTRHSPIELVVPSGAMVSGTVRASCPWCGTRGASPAWRATAWRAARTPSRRRRVLPSSPMTWRAPQRSSGSALLAVPARRPGAARHGHGGRRARARGPARRQRPALRPGRPRPGVRGDPLPLRGGPGAGAWWCAAGSTRRAAPASTGSPRSCRKDQQAAPGARGPFEVMGAAPGICSSARTARRCGGG